MGKNEENKINKKRLKRFCSALEELVRELFHEEDQFVSVGAVVMLREKSKEIPGDMATVSITAEKGERGLEYLKEALEDFSKNVIPKKTISEGEKDVLLNDLEKFLKERTNE